MGRTKRTTTDFYNLAQRVFAPFINSLPTLQRKLAKDLFAKGRKHMHALTVGTTPLQFQPMLVVMMLEIYIEILDAAEEKEKLNGQ